jgi:hypothetical protein
MATRLQIINLALTRIGIPRISQTDLDNADSGSGASKAALTASAVWDQVRDEVLTKHAWNALTSRANLVRATDAAKTITSISASTTSVFTTSVDHGYQAGDIVYVKGVEGCLDVYGDSAVNGKYHTITSVTATTFTTQTDTASASAYIQDGLALRVRTKRLTELATTTTAVAIAASTPLLGEVTLATSPATTTLISHASITASSRVLLMPKTANAAAAALVVYATVASGAVTINHSSSSLSDRTFHYAIFLV